MQKQLISFFLSLVVLAVITSCGHKNSTQHADPSSTEQTTVDTTGTSQPVAAVYQCPMKCEGDKTYDKPGKCPKCKMDLEDIAGHEGHDH